MIPRRTVTGIAAVGVLAALSFWLNRVPETDEPSAIAGLDTRLNYALQDFEALYYDQQGQLAGKVTAPRLANDAETGIGVIDRPRFQVVHDGHHWTILSESAIVTPDREYVRFSGQVNMLGRDQAQGREVSIQTSEVTLEIDPRIVHSDQAITIVQGQNALNAHGFRLDMTSEQFHLDSQVEGRYVVQ
jgi:LPS export ABC transporter protein LptC